jgi:hypothetical protein
VPDLAVAQPDDTVDDASRVRSHWPHQVFVNQDFTVAGAD